MIHGVNKHYRDGAHLLVRNRSFYIFKCIDVQFLCDNHQACLEKLHYPTVLFIYKQTSYLQPTITQSKDIFLSEQILPCGREGQVAHKYKSQKEREGYLMLYPKSTITTLTLSCPQRSCKSILRFTPKSSIEPHNNISQQQSNLHV